MGGVEFCSLCGASMQEVQKTSIGNFIKCENYAL